MLGGLKNVWEVRQQILCMDLKKKMLGGGGVVMPKYFTDLKNIGGGGYANKFMDLKNVWGVMLKYFRDLKKNVGGGGVMPKYFRL